MPEGPPVSSQLALWLESFLGGAELRQDDARMQRVNLLQRLGYVSARPEDCASGWRVRVRLTDAGYAALGRAPRRRP
ncbi:MAG: hypothetical protein NVS2B11_07070 [Acetobacteraceae bacterium]